MIIHGDNLFVLKSLLPKYKGKIKCIYIDPPYNTGNEKWIYNDNVNDPKIKKWLDEAVGKKDKNFSKHDKWLCMMYPRLVLLRELLCNDGIIFISIDDHEQANLKLICDMIFEKKNFICCTPWRKRTINSNGHFGISQDYEWILCYSKSDQFLAKIKNENRKYYDSEDFPGNPWRIGHLTTQSTATESPNSFFDMINPKTQEKYPPNPNRTWAVTKHTFDKYYKEHKIIFPDDYKFLNISSPVMRYFKKDDIKKAGDRFGYQVVSTNLLKNVGMTKDGTKEFIKIFNNKIFRFPKPVPLIKMLITISTSDSDIILDAFAGSGTTAHAVLNMNKEDSGNRKFILIEMGDFADSITAERIKRVINGYSDVEGTGGNFNYYELSEQIN